MYVDLNKRSVTDAMKAVNFASLDDKNVTCACFEFLPVNYPETSAFSHELDFVVRMTMRAGAPAWQGSKEEYGDIHVAVVLSDKLVRAALEWQILLANSIHPADTPEIDVRRLQNTGK